MVISKWVWRAWKMTVTVLLIFVTVIFLLSALGTVAHAAGLVDDTVNSSNEYSKYPLDNYQLDFYVDTGWDWLPWNWLDGIGKQVMYGLYAITNFIWTISLYLSNATGYLIQEAYSLDFISATADSVGKNMQTLAGVTSNGLSSEGFYIGFLMILILVMGIYVAYTGLVKRETTKAIHAIVNFVVVFVLSASFIAYAPDYVKKINEFSTDISNASLSLGTKMVMPNSVSQGKNSVDLIRDSLYSIQVQQPWLLLQFGNSNIESIGVERVENLLSTSPNENNGKDREEIIVEEIEDRENTNLTVTKTINRLGMVFFLFCFNIGISIFVFLLTGIMIFSQALFIIYAMFLPVSFIMSMIPTFDGISKRAITKLFNAILTRAGITLIITIAFSISSMLYTLSADYPFFMIAFLQIVTFAGIYFKLGDLMSMFSLQSGDSQNMGRQIMRKPRMLMHSHMHRLQHKLGRSISVLGGSKSSKKSMSNSGLKASRTAQAEHSRTDLQNVKENKKSSGKREAQVAGATVETNECIRDTIDKQKEQVKDLPVNTKNAKYNDKTHVVNGEHDVSSNIIQTRAESRKTITEYGTEIEQKKPKKELTTGSKELVTPALERQRIPTLNKVNKSGSHQSQIIRPVVQTDKVTKPIDRTTLTNAKDKSEPPVMDGKQAINKKMPLANKERQIVKSNAISSIDEHPTLKTKIPLANKERQIINSDIKSATAENQDIKTKLSPVRMKDQIVHADKTLERKTVSVSSNLKQKSLTPLVKESQHVSIKRQSAKQKKGQIK